MASVVTRGEVWTGRRVLLTGHTGFKGSWLAFWLTSLGAKVHGLALNPTTEPNLYEILRLDDSVESHIGDIRDLECVRGAFTRANPEIVFHLAAQPLVRASYADPVGTLSANAMGTAHVLEAARGRDLHAAIIVTTDKVYENDGLGRKFSEDDPLGGRDPYSASKAAAEIIAASYRESFFLNDAIVATVRAGNVIGGGDWSPDRIVTDLVRASRLGTPVSLRYPSAVRPWQHVIDALDGYLLVAERALAGDRSVGRPWNFGPTAKSASLTVGEFARNMLSALGSSSEIEHDKTDVPHEAPMLALESRAAQTLLGWSPRWNAEEAIRQTGAWYRRFYSGDDMGECTKMQLQRESLA